MMHGKHDVQNDTLLDHNVFPHMTGTKDIEDQELHHVLKVSITKKLPGNHGQTKFEKVKVVTKNKRPVVPLPRTKREA